MALTLRQNEVLTYIRQVEIQRGAGPTTREVQNRFGFQSQTAAVKHIRALERHGVLDKTPGKARAVTTSPPRSNLVQVPIFGTLPAGVPELLESQPEGFVSVDTVALGVSDHAPLFSTWVRGDSMIDAHILDGDLAVFVSDCEPQHGKIVAALIDGENTLKRYLCEGDKVFLKAENPRYADLIPAHELLIQGVLVHLQRTLQGF